MLECCGEGGKTYPSRLAVEDERGFLVAEAQLQPHSVCLHQSVQDAEPPMERVVARVSGSAGSPSDPSSRTGLQEETAYLLTQTAGQKRNSSTNGSFIQKVKQKVNSFIQFQDSIFLNSKRDFFPL